MPGSSSTNWLSKPCLSGQSWSPVNSRLGKAGFKAYCSAAHRVRGDLVRTLIGLTAQSGLTAQRVGARGWEHRLVSRPQPASGLTKGSACSSLGGLIDLGAQLLF